ncbi:MAG: prmB [Francisellaceae bacterium]|nr:prmB [Francisellaceae bacterium]
MITQSNLILSQVPDRNQLFFNFLGKDPQKHYILKDLIKLGCKLMKKEKLHPHFFDNNTLLANAQYLACFYLKLPYDLSNEDFTKITLNKKQVIDIIKLFERRIAEKIPVEFITNEAYYLGNKFYVNENVLVPRSIINTRFEDFLNDMEWENYRVLDLCCGSGCIGISLALLNPNIKVDLADISEKALVVASKNINNYLLNERVKIIHSDLFKNIHNKYDLIITNPPYVTEASYKKIPAEFKNEPKIALECGKEGLDLIHKIIHQSKNYLNPKGKLIAEIGYPAAYLIKRKYPKLFLEWLSYRKPEDQQSWFDKWLAPLVAMPGAFICQAQNLPIMRI